jgi:hypothetical protein
MRGAVYSFKPETAEAERLRGGMLQMSKITFYAFLLIGCLGISLQAQTTGTISGVVTDASGATVAGAKIDVKNIETGALRAATSDAQGRYTACALRFESQTSSPGPHTVRSAVQRHHAERLGPKCGRLFAAGGASQQSWCFD